MSENSQPIIVEQSSQFIVNIKLLSNEVFKISAASNMLVSQFRKLVAQHTNVPVQRQRLVFGGKPLQDNSPLSQYLKQSGLTVHLIARAPPAPEAPQNPPSPQPQPNSMPNPLPFNLPNLLNLPGMAPLNLANIFGPGDSNPMNIQIRVINGVVQPQNNQPPPNQNISNPQANSQQNSRQNGGQNIQNQLNIAHLNELHMNISRVNYPVEQPQPQWTLRQHLVLYLKRLQNQILRFTPVLNRGIQQLQQGRVNQIRQLVPIFNSLNHANQVAIQAINRIQPQNQQSQAQSQPQSQPQSTQNRNTQNLPQSQNNQNRQPEFNIMNTLSGLAQPGSGFNFGAIFNQLPNQTQNNTNNVAQSQPQQTRSSQPQSQVVQPLPPPQPQPQVAQSLPQVTQSQEQNPLGGLNFMSIMNGLGPGGAGQLLSMSLGDMLQQGGQPTIYSSILKPLTGSELLGVFTQKNFSFINTKRNEFRQNILKAIGIIGSRQALIQKIAKDFSQLIIPKQNVKNEQQCRANLHKLLIKHIQHIINLFLNNNQNLQNSVITSFKKMLCQSIDKVTTHVERTDLVFANIKANFIAEMQNFTPGLSGLFYTIIQKDLFRIYKQHEEQNKRKQMMSQEEAHNQVQLIQRIQAAHQDQQYLQNFTYSVYYPNKP